MMRRLLSKTQGAALVIVLALVVLLTALVVAFFSQAMAGRQLSNSSFNQSRSDDLVRSALDIIVGDLRQEIANPIANEPIDPNVALYFPKAEKPAGVTTYPSLAPVRHGVPPLSGGKYPIPNLIRISTPASIASPGIDHPASSGVLSTTPSANGQSISLQRWNRHYLIPRLNPGNNSIDTTPIAAFTAPSWVFVTDQGPQVLTAPTRAVVGRYAYAIYDEGGLLDANSAGYPSSLPATAPHPGPDAYKSVRFGYGGKGALAFADLTQLGLTTLQVDNLVGWRNYASAKAAGAFGSFTFSPTGAASYFDTVVANRKTGAFKVSSQVSGGRTDQAFLSRQQLIDLLTQGLAPAGGSAQLQNSLQYLGTFSRGVNAPVWSPTANAADLGGSNGAGNIFAYKDNADSPSAVNRNIAKVRVSTPFTRPDGTAATAGSPLLSKRFPLSRIGLLTYSTVSSDAAGADVFKFFGLKRANKSDPWIYYNVDGTVATEIKTLKQAADEGREPNFFELLYAGILNGSLGVSKGGGVLKVIPQIDGNAFLQLMRIGANIVDQYDADNYPTILSFNGIKLSGIEDIPYPNKILWKLVTGSPDQVPASPRNWFDPIMPEIFFEMWNPHQQPPSPTATGPTEFRIIVNPEATYRIMTVLNNATFNKPATTPANPAWTPFPTGVSVKFTLNSNSDYREPAVIRRDSATPAGDSSILSFPTTGSKALGFTLPGPQILPGTYPTGSTLGYLKSPGSATPGQVWYYVYENNTTIYSYQYKDANNVWQTYSTSGGVEELPLTTGIRNTGTWGYVVYNPWQSGSTSNPNQNQPYCRPDCLEGLPWIRSDPRTSRLGLSMGGIASGNRYTANPSPLMAGNPLITSLNEITYASGQQPWTTPSGNFRLDWMSQNGTASLPGGSWFYTSYTDVDGVIRAGDSYLSTSNQPMKANQTATRPILLNRPFRSVGELGYVFRDIPWKTVDLFSAKSADTALLDLFSVDEDVNVMSGRVSLNTQNPEVLKAILAGSTIQEAGGTTLSASVADTVAKAITSSSSGPAGPVLNFEALSDRLADNMSAMASTNKLEREAVMRALAGSTSTQTWNLLIDVVAQTGKFTQRSIAQNDLNSFVVEGSRRYWLHVAIDRYTGKVIDHLMERVDE